MALFAKFKWKSINTVQVITVLVVFAGLFILSQYNYLLFHVIAEGFGIIVAVALFFIVWNARDKLDNPFFSIIGVAYLCVAGIDLLHTAAYKGMGIFDLTGSNLATQLWISARYLESLSIVIALLLIRKNVKIQYTLPVYLAFTILLMLSIFLWDIFPVCYVEGSGLTVFKITSEYIISGIIIVAVWLLWKNKHTFSSLMVRLLTVSLLATILAEMCFTLYTDVYGILNALGHFLKIISFYFIYLAIVESGINQPFKVLLRDFALRAHGLDNATDSVCILDREGIIVYVNESFCKIRGFTRDEVLGKNIAELPTSATPEIFQTIHEQLEAKGSSVFETTHFHKDGTPIHFEVHSKVIVIDEKTYSLNIEIDITKRHQAENTLKLSMDNSPYPICINNIEGNFTYVNQAMLDIFGYADIVEMNSASYKERYDPEYQKTVEQTRYQQQHGYFENKQIMHRLFRRNGEIRIVDAFIQPILWENQDQFQVTYKDITAQVQEEEDRKRSEARYRNLIENSPVGITVSTDDGTIIDANNVLLEMHGYSTLEELQRTSVSDRYADPKDRDRWLKIVNEEGIVNGFEMKLKRKDGTEFWVIMDSIPGADEFSEPYLITVLRDITEQVRAEENSAVLYKELKDSEKNFRNSIDNSPLGIIISSGYGKPIYANKVVLNIFGYNSIEELQTTDVDKRYLPENTERIKSRMARLLNGVTTFESDTYFIKRPNGDFRYIEVNATRIIWNGENCVLSMFQDITERNRAEERERLLQQELIAQSRLATVGEMAAGIAHEINNPLTGVIGFTSLLMQRDLPEDIKDELATINEGAQRVASIVNRMLSFARQKELSFESTDVNELIETVVRFRSHDAELNNIKIVKNLDTGLPLTQLDSGQIQQVFLNIIINAELEMKNAHNGGTLTITTEHKEDTIKIIFDDDGPGIRREDSERIFDPFYTTRTVGEGTGLGLSVSYGIIANHNGKIYAESEYGKGARFIIELPVNQPQVETDGDEEEHDGGTVDKVSGTVLAVDDEEIIRNLLQTLLTNEGYTVEVVSNAQEALEMLKQTTFDAVLLDIRMPEISGIELYEKILEDFPGYREKVIFMSGDTMNAYTISYLEYAGVPHISKPFTNDDVINRIKEVISN